MEQFAIVWGFLENIQTDKHGGLLLAIPHFIVLKSQARPPWGVDTYT